MKKKILIIDDEPDLRKIVSWFFQSKGYEIIEASNGTQGIAKVKEELPDLILLDIMMPEMDGWEVAKKIKEDKALSGTPISVLSVKSDPQDIDKSINYAHADTHISKPIDFYMLNNTVKNLIQRSD